MRKIVVLLIAVLFASTVRAADVNIDVKDHFSAGETIFFNYTLISGTEEEITFAAFVHCPKGPGDVPEELVAAVSPDSLYTGTHTFVKVDENIETQNCEAVVQIISPVEQQYKKSFAVNSIPRLSFSMQTCKDSRCEEESTTFLKGRTVFIKTSALTGTEIKGNYIDPAGVMHELTFTDGLASFTGQQGTYTIEVSAEKTGYRTEQARAQIAFVDSIPEIRDASMCNANSVCDSTENHQLCPQDCAVPEAQDFLLFILIILLFAAAFFVIIIRKKQQQNKT